MDILKNRLLPATITACVAVGIVVVSDLFSFAVAGSFAWISFFVWTFAAKPAVKISRKELLLKTIIGLPIGLLLSICMLYVPGLLGGFILLKYLMVFLANLVAILIFSKFVSGVFMGISFAFSGLGCGLFPSDLQNTAIVLLVIIVFSSIGIFATWITERNQSD